jgi:phospholipid N-methyltransferase
VYEIFVFFLNKLEKSGYFNWHKPENFGERVVNNGLFVNQFFKRPKEIGTFTQSSKFLAEKMARAIGDSEGVVEFGAGAGAITREILRVLPPQGLLTCFDTNPLFCEMLRNDIKDERLTVINDIAENAEEYVDCSDCIVSSVPLAIMTKEQRERILVLSSRARRFIQLGYMPILTREIKQYFEQVETKFVPLNLPPAFVYICQS